MTEVDDADAIQRLMAAITFKEIDDLTQAEAAALYGYSPSWASKWFSRLENLDDAPLEEVVHDQSRSVGRRNSPTNYIGGSWTE